MSRAQFRPSPLAAAALLASSLVGSQLLLAGPLAPPAGPVSPTNKTLQQVEPRVDIATLPGGVASTGEPVRHLISQPGSYYLSSNITLAANQVGIFVSASNVTIDLNGFTIDGAGVSNDAINFNPDGVGRSNIVVRNGTIRNTVKEAIDGFAAPRAVIENLTVDTVLNGFGVIVGTSSSVSRVTVRSVGSGIIVGEHSRLTDSIVDAASGNAFELGAHTVASGCIARGSTGAGSRGFLTAEGVTLDNCTAAANAGLGFSLGDRSVARNCSSNANAGGGFVAGLGSSILECIASSNAGTSIRLNGNGFVSRAQVFGGTIGIQLTNGGNRVENSKIGNAITAISSAGLDVILNNSMNAAAVNTGDAILLNGQDSLVDGNYAYAFNRGIVVNGSLNTIIRNRFHLVGLPITGAGATDAMVAPIVNTATATTNPLANTTQ